MALVALAVAAACFAIAPVRAAAVTTTSTKTTVAPAGAAASAVYTISGFRAKNETVTRYSVTFPAGTNVSGAAGPNLGDTVIVSGQTVTIVLATPIVGGGGGGVAFDAVFRNINNPITPGSYSLPSITFLTNGANQTINLGKAGNYRILVSPYLTLTITTPDVAQTVDFGSVDPGQPSTANVIIEVDSSSPWTMTRALTGAVAALGLQVTGPAPIGIAVPAGFHSYTELYEVNPPWTTVPGVAYSAAVTYTVIQQ